jgi:peptide/nickel transport system substrate-binding protein
MIPIRRLRCSRQVAVTAVLSLLVLGATAHAAPGHVQAALHHAGTAANTLSIGWSIETKTLDPVNNPQNPDIWVMVNIYDQLVRVGNDGTSLVPDLATSWTISKDLTVYTFHLRKGVAFHNGQTLTAEDVRFCLDRARNPKQPWSWTLAAIKKVEAPDPTTVRVTLKHPWAPFLSDVSLFDTGIYPEAYFKTVGASYMTAHPIGTGPYMFDSWKRGQYLRLKKNPHYWMADKFPMQYVEYDLIPNDNTRLLKVEAGELDVDNVLPHNLIAQVKNNPSVKVVIDRSTQTNYFVPNTKVAPFGDVKVRQAITHAIDRAALVKAVLYGYGTPANSFMPRGAIDYDPNIPVPSYDPALARKLLSASSVPHGFTMTFDVGSGDTVGNEEAVIFKSEVAPLGIKVNIKPEDPTTLFNDQNAGKYSFTNNLWTNDIPDPDELVAFSTNYAPGSWNFFTWYHNLDVSRLSHEAEQTNDTATRKRLYYQIQEIWARDQWFFALYYPPFVNAVSSRVQGFHESPLGYFVLQGVHKA